MTTPTITEAAERRRTVAVATTGTRHPRIANTTPVGTQAATAPLRGTLVATVTASGTVKLTTKGRPVTSLKAGRYTFAVTDSSGKAGFNVQRIKSGAVTLTTSAFTGKRSKTLNLKAGQWFFYPSFIGKKNYFIVVT